MFAPDNEPHFLKVQGHSEAIVNDRVAFYKEKGYEEPRNILEYSYPYYSRLLFWKKQDEHVVV